MTQCAKIIVGFMANVGNVFYPTFTNVFLFSPRFLRFLFSSQRLLHLWLQTKPKVSYGLIKALQNIFGTQKWGTVFEISP